MGDNTQTIFVGSRFKNNFGTWATVIEYNGSKRIKVKFEDEHAHEAVYVSSSLYSGSFRNPFDPIIYGIGYYGFGPEKSSINGKVNPLLGIWAGMLKRCYDNDESLRMRAYLKCFVHKEWHNFQNFATWARQQIGFDLETRNLDKDILVKGNREYGPTTCCFVPSRINMLFVRASTVRGELPIGLYFNKEKQKYQAQCNDENCKSTYLGRFDTIHEAFISYKIYKESVIKKVAEQYKEDIDPRVYTALYNYEVELED